MSKLSSEIEERRQKLIDEMRTIEKTLDNEITSFNRKIQTFKLHVADLVVDYNTYAKNARQLQKDALKEVKHLRKSQTDKKLDAAFIRWVSELNALNLDDMDNPTNALDLIDESECSALTELDESWHGRLESQ